MKPKAKPVKIELPSWWLQEATDYHEFIYIRNILRDDLGIKVNYEEINNTAYMAIFWIGKKPKDVIKYYSDLNVGEDED